MVRKKKSASDKKSGSGALLILLLMIIVGLIFGYFFYTYTKTFRTRIYLFNGNYSAGTVIDKSMLASQEIDTETYNALMQSADGAKYATAQELNEYISNGDRLAADVATYTPVFTTHFVSTGGTPVARGLSDNMVAVEILASDVHGLSGNEVVPESRINVTSHYEIDERTISDLIFQDLRIIDVIYDADENIYSVFVEMKPADAIILQHALVAEKVSISVLKTGAYTPISQNTEYEKVYDTPDVFVNSRQMP